MQAYERDEEQLGHATVWASTTGSLDFSCDDAMTYHMDKTKTIMQDADKLKLFDNTLGAT